MNQILKILQDKSKKLAILIDPDKFHSDNQLKPFVEKINQLKPAFIFVGGSTVNPADFNQTVEYISAHSNIPLVIFPGAHTQIHPKAKGILFLSLLSGRNPDFLIGHQVEAAFALKQMDLEVIPTAYLLIDGGKSTSVSYVSQTSPIPADQTGIASKTALAGELLGMKTVFMDAGSGALNPISSQMISAVKSQINVPLIIGGGMKSVEDIEKAFNAGADVAVIGNKIEENIDFLLDLIPYNQTLTA